MSFSKIASSILWLCVALCMISGVTTSVLADDEKRIASRKRCHNYDRAESQDEEKSSGECGGTVPTPEPVSIILFTAGLAGVGFAARRRLRRPE